MILERVREGAVGAAVTSGRLAGEEEKHQRWAEAEAEAEEEEEAVAPRDAELRKESYRREYEEAK